jgi:phage terminase Nu1 subunit (DNA packaging protein)
VAVIDWILARNNTGNGKLDPIEARARKDDEMAKRYAMDNEVRRGELLEVEDVRATWEDHIASAKAALRGIPAKVAPQVAAEADPNAVNEILLDTIDEALEELAGEDG